MDLDRNSPGSPSRVRAVTFRAVLFLAMAVSASIVFAMSALAPLVTQDLGLSRFQFGLLPSIHSFLAGLGSVVAGKIVDAQGGRRTMIALFAIGVVGSFVAGRAGAFWQLMLAVAFLSIPLALANPTTNLLIAQHVPRPQQGSAVGIKQAGTPAGTALTGFLLPPLAILLGWRPAVQVLAVVALIGLVGVLVVVPRSVKTTSQQRRTGRLPEPHRTGARWLALYGFLMGSGMGSVNAFVPLYAHERLGLAVVTSGRLAATIGLSAIFSRIIWGHIANRMDDPGAALKYLAGFASLAVGCLMLAAVVDWRLAWVAAAAIGCSAGTWHVPVMVSIIREAGAYSGEVSGTVMQGFLMGLVISPVVFGFSVDAGIGYLGSWAGVVACFLAAGLVQHAHERRIQQPDRRG